MPQSESAGPLSLARRPAHLGVGATAIPQPEFTGDMAWYTGYGERHGGEGREGRLLSMHTFDAPWSSWECHPEGAEVILVTAGRLELILEQEGEQRRVEVDAGCYTIVPPGAWHTADAEAPVTAVFITCGAGTEHRPR